MEFRLARAPEREQHTHLEALARAEGWDLEETSTEAALALAGRVLGSAWARTLGESALHRRLPYALDLSDGLTLEGQVDLLRELPGGGAELLLYKDGARPAQGAAAHAQELAALRLAAGSLLPGDARVRVGVLFLQEPEPDFLEPAAGDLETLAGGLREAARARLSSQGETGS